MKPSTRLSISNAYFTPLLMSLNSINLALSFSLTVLGGAVPPEDLSFNLNLTGT